MHLDRPTGQNSASYPDSSINDEVRFTSASPAPILRKRLWFLTRFGITGLLFWMVFRTVDPSPVLSQLAGLNPWLLVLAVGVLALQITLAAVRWGYILKVAGTPLPSPLLIRFMLIGQFFNQVMVSTIGGDVVRVWLAGQAGGSYRAAAVGVLADRGFGVFTLLLLVAAIWPLHGSFAISAALGSAGLGFVALGIASFIGLAFFGCRLGRNCQHWRSLRPLGELAALLGRILGNHGSAGGVLGLSLVVHGMSVLAVKLLALSLNIEVSFVALAVVVPVVLLLLIIPITIGGWGLREGLMITGLGFVGVSPAEGLALSVMFGFGLTVIGIPGGLIWLKGHDCFAKE